jgi:hypothetical protein
MFPKHVVDRAREREEQAFHIIWNHERALWCGANFPGDDHTEDPSYCPYVQPGAHYEFWAVNTTDEILNPGPTTHRNWRQ